MGIAREAARYVHARTVYLGTALRPDVRTPDKSPGQTRECLMVLGVSSPRARCGRPPPPSSLLLPSSFVILFPLAPFSLPRSSPHFYALLLTPPLIFPLLRPSSPSSAILLPPASFSSLLRLPPPTYALLLPALSPLLRD